MRIIGGTYRGRVLAEFAGNDIRPTADRVKESLFGILTPRLYDANVLDVFCGSGNLGIEALSRMAKYCHFNDVSNASLSVLKKNLEKLKVEPQKVKITHLDYLQALNATTEKFDIIFLDPPYRFDYGVPALQVIAKRRLLTEGGVAVYERDRSFTEKVAGLCKTDERKYGLTYLSFFRYAEEAEAEEEA